MNRNVMDLLAYPDKYNCAEKRVSTHTANDVLDTYYLWVEIRNVSRFLCCE